MYEIEKTFTISASHRLDLSYDSPCCRDHGHNFRVKVTCKGVNLNEEGMLVDFSQIKKNVQNMFDHKFLNEVFLQISHSGEKINPTAENLAKLIFYMVPQCTRVDVWETEDNQASYFEE